MIDPRSSPSVKCVGKGSEGYQEPSRPSYDWSMFTVSLFGDRGDKYIY